MKILWLSTSSMQLEPVIHSLSYSMKLLFASVSSMNLEPIYTGLTKQLGDTLSIPGIPGDPPFVLCKFDRGKEEQHHYEGEVDHVILSVFDEYKPDVVIYSGPAEGKCRPLLSTFLRMRESSKVVNLVCDGGCPNWHPLLETYLKGDCFDLAVNIDGNPNWPQQPRDITWIGPIDPRYFEKMIPKGVDFGFAGGLGSSSRREITNRLAQSCQLTIPQRSETWGTYQAYADFMLSCRSIFNMGRTGSGKTFHVKYRVIETALSGAVLYEEVNPITRLYFEPGMDYIEYDGVEDLEQKVKLNLHKHFSPIPLKEKIMTKWSADQLWEKVFNALGLKKPF